MSRGWVRSGLTVGDELKIPTRLFIEPEKALDKFIGAYYTRETDTGIMIECVFKPSFGISANIKSYLKFIDWASIWCGQVKIYKEDNSLLRARRRNGLPIALGQSSPEE